MRRAARTQLPQLAELSSHKAGPFRHQADAQEFLWRDITADVFRHVTDGSHDDWVWLALICWAPLGLIVHSASIDNIVR